MRSLINYLNKKINVKKERIVVTQLAGGLGNQMFRYAAGIALAQRLKATLLVDFTFHIKNDTDYGDFVARPFQLNIFPNVHEECIVVEDYFRRSEILQWFLRKLNLPEYGLPVYKEPFFHFDNQIVQLEAPVIIDGDWQSELYFKEYEHIIRNCFAFPDLNSEEWSVVLLRKIESTNSVAIHVRRGDYLFAYNYAINGVCPIDYYRNAIALMKQKVPDPYFYLFSDDPEWVKTSFADLTDPFDVVEGNKGNNSWKDMLLMSKCRHQIIANSSFSWWSAWLNNNPGKIVIAPQNWFAHGRDSDTKDLIPGTWFRID
jgi:hypothetical protein